MLTGQPQTNVFAYAAFEKGAPVKEHTVTWPAHLEDDYVEVKVTHSGICYSDVGWIDNDSGFSSYPAVCGHEVVGVVSAFGAKVTKFKIGDRVGCSNVRSSCQNCDFCQAGNGNYCKKFDWMVKNGGFARYVRLQYTNVFKLPDNIEFQHAAPLMCAGSTVYAPFRVNNVLPTHKVAVQGIGGLGHIALQIARAWGCEVTAISTTSDKEQEARQFGANHFLLSTDPEQSKKFADTFDFLMITGTKEIDPNYYINLMKTGGAICILGLPGNKMVFDPIVPLIFKAIKVVGGCGCCRSQYQEMVEFCARHSIKPQTELLPFNEINKGLQKVREGKARYRVVLVLE